MKQSPIGLDVKDPWAQRRTIESLTVRPNPIICFAMQALYYLMPIILGFLIPIQSLLNAKLGQRVGSPFIGAAINFAVEFALALTILALIRPAPSRHLVEMDIPWYLYLGGFVGVTYILSTIIIVPKVGNLGFIALIVFSQLFASALYDHIGLFGVIKIPFQPLKLVGFLFLIAGLLLVLKK